MTDQTDDARKAEEMWTALRGKLEAEAAAVDVEKEAWRHLVAQAGGAAEHLVAQASPNAAGQRDYYNIVVWAEDRVPDDTGWILVDEAFGDCVTPDGHVDHQALDNLLAAIGYRRIGEWDDAAGGQIGEWDDAAGGQIYADVEPGP